MKISIAKNEGDLVRVTVSGEVTQRELNPTQDPLIDLLGPDGYSRNVRMDLSEASYLDSSGVGWLLACNKRIKQAGGRLTLERPHPIVANVLKVLKLERVFDVDAGQQVERSGGAA
jgi:anti-anti-sigma factor